MIINIAKIFGVLFYQQQTRQELIDMSDALLSSGAIREETMHSLVTSSEADLIDDFSVLFQGMGKMPLPPWGSVYLDREKVLFGDSTLEYRAFLHRNGVELDTGLREPEDQFGLMLLAYAQLLSDNKEEAANELMSVHLLPWGIYYLERLSNYSESNYYGNLAKDVINWLNNNVVKGEMQIIERELFIDG